MSSFCLLKGRPMKKFFLVFFILLSININALVLQDCYNFGDEVSFSYENCINSNFSTIDRDLFNNSLFLRRCSNFGNGVEFSFVNCINNNFSTIERECLENLFLTDCFNYGTTLTSNFTYWRDRFFRTSIH